MGVAGSGPERLLGGSKGDVPAPSEGERSGAAESKQTSLGRTRVVGIRASPSLMLWRSCEKQMQHFHLFGKASGAFPPRAKRAWRENTFIRYYMCVRVILQFVSDMFVGWSPTHVREHVMACPPRAPFC